MTNFLRKLFSPFMKAVSATGLNRLPVFYQIIMVVAIMILFTGTQAYLNDRILNTAQNTVQSSSLYQLNQISKLKQDILGLLPAYLELIVEEAISADLVLGRLNWLMPSINVIDSIAPETRAEIIQRLEKAAGQLKTAPNIETYRDLRYDLLAASVMLESLHSEGSSSTLQTSIIGRQYLNKSRRNSIVIMIIGASFSILLGLTIASSISYPLKRIVEATGLLAAGDLSRNISVTGSPEITRVVNGLNQAITSLRTLVGNIRDQSATLYSASEELRNSSLETEKAATEVASTIRKLATGATAQAAQIDQAVDAIHSVSTTIRKVTTDSGTLTSVSKNVSEIAETGLKASNDIINEIQVLYTSTKEVDEAIAELSRASEEIDKTTVLIQRIAEQTSLLALNASIEAARAGDYGRGFGVVAQETSKLADQTKNAAGLIANLVKEIKERTDRAVVMTRTGTERAEHGRNLANNTQGTFQEIFQSINGILTQIDTVTESAQNMTHSNQRMIDSIKTIAEIREESLASTEDVTTATERQNALMEKVSDLAESLSRVANSLQEVVTVFQVE